MATAGKLVKNVRIAEEDVFSLQLLYTHLISELDAEQLKKIKETKTFPAYLKTLVRIIRTCDPSFDLNLFDD